MSDDIKIEEEGGEVTDKLKKLREKIKKCQKEKEEYLDGWQRAKADAINKQKEDGKRQKEFVRFSNQMVFSELLPVLDSFDLALSTKKKQKNVPEDFMKGFCLIRSQLENILKQNGVEVIKTKNEKFDPELHESIEELESKKPSGTIIEEIQKGYKFHDKILRAAKVKVSK